MAESVVSLTYGAALFEAAKDLGKEEVFLRELEILDEILKETPEAGEFLNSPAIMAPDKKKIIESSLKGKFSREMINFLFVLVDKSRTAEISKIRKQYMRLYDKERNIIKWSDLQLPHNTTFQFNNGLLVYENNSFYGTVIVKIK